MNQYERERIHQQIDGYYMPKALHAPEKSFDAAKKELLENLQKHIDKVRQYSYNHWQIDTDKQGE